MKSHSQSLRRILRLNLVFLAVSTWMAGSWSGFLADCDAFPNASGLMAAERQATPVSSISVRHGFVVELLRSAQQDEGSWISLTFDHRGRIVLGIDDTGLARLTISPNGSESKFERLDNTQSFRHVRGVLFANDSLYVCATDSQAVYRLRDTNGDDQYDDIQKLMEVDYRSRYGHGTNQIVTAPGIPPWGPPDSQTVPSDSLTRRGLPDHNLYLVQGNDVSFPESIDPNSPYKNPQNDWLLPNPHDAGHDDRVGHILHIDPQGQLRTVVAGGFRNQFDIAFNADGEMFTWDADMEWDVGLPWYRPTRLNHVVSGGEYGWRWGTGKWPAWYPDSLPSTLDTGLSSPTGLVMGLGSRWPQRYRQSLLMADWQNGRILLVDLIPQGASYAARSELFLEGAPLNVCDLAFGPDGNLYFITGGRGSQSGLYRVRYAPTADNISEDSEVTSDQSQEEIEAHRLSRQLRHQLETYHRKQDPQAIDFIWRHLGSQDRWISFAARLALENQPLEDWRARVAQSPDSLERRMSLLALSRAGAESDQSIVLAGLQELPWASLSSEELLLPLRTLQLTFIRQRPADSDSRNLALGFIDELFPDESFPANWLLAELLVYLKAPNAAERLLDLLEKAPTQEEQIQYFKTLVRSADTLDASHKQRLLDWLIRSRPMPGGKLVSTTMDNLRADLVASFTEADHQKFVDQLAELSSPAKDRHLNSQRARPIIHHWTMDDLLNDVLTISSRQFDPAMGQSALVAAECLRCHRFGQRGGQIGPDLSNVGKRMDGRALLESILEPSRQIDPKYQISNYLMVDGQVVTGRPTGVSRSHLTIELDPLTGESLEIARDQIEQTQTSTVSPMPVGLLDTLTREQILSMIALLRN